MRKLPTRGPGESLAHFARRLARRPLRRLGFDIQRIDPHRRETLEQAVRQLWRVGMRPRTVIDVGVAAGTPELYETFPDAYFLLVEPVAENEPLLRRILERVQGDYALVAAASRSGTIELRVSPDPREQWSSTIFKTVGSGTEDWIKRPIPAARLDDLVAERRLEGPFLIKADTEGSELQVLGGAEWILERTSAVLLEVTLVDYFEGGPRFADVVRYMAERGFVVYDIVGGFSRSSDGALVLVDMVFIREPGRSSTTARARERAATSAR